MNGGLGPLQGLGFQGNMSFRFLPTSESATTVILEYRVTGYDPDGLKPWAPIVDSVLRQQLESLQSSLMLAR